MKKIIRIMSIILVFVCVVILSSCGKKSGVDVAIENKIYATKVQFDLTFSENENLSSGNAIPHIKRYSYDEEADDKVGAYASENKTISFSSGVYTSASVEFTSLTAGTKYAFRLYVTFNKSEELIKTWTIETKKNGADDVVMISTVSDFNAMADDPTANYKLANDIDFEGAKVKALFTSTASKKFSGTFDGDGKSIKNFQLDTANNGLFAYTSKATIKNLVVEPGNGEEAYTMDCSSGKSSADIGIIAGNAEETKFENITIDGAKIRIKGNSSAKLNLGIVVGKADKCAFKDVNVKNAAIEYDYMRQAVNTGLFAGVILGDSTVKENDEAYSVLNCSAEGSIEGLIYFTSAADGDQVYCGGFVGSVGCATAIKNSYVVADINIYNDEANAEKASGSNFRFSVGGFTAGNFYGSMKLLGCAAVADINVYSCKKNSEKMSTADTIVLTKSFANIGGLIGTANMTIDTVSDCVYVMKDTGVSVLAKAYEDMKDPDDEENTIPDTTKPLYSKSNVVACYYKGANVVNTGCVNDGFAVPTLSDAVKAIVNKYNK